MNKKIAQKASEIIKKRLQNVVRKFDAAVETELGVQLENLKDENKRRDQENISALKRKLKDLEI